MFRFLGVNRVAIFINLDLGLFLIATDDGPQNNGGDGRQSPESQECTLSPAMLLLLLLGCRAVLSSAAISTKPGRELEADATEGKAFRSQRRNMDMSESRQASFESCDWVVVEEIAAGSWDSREWVCR